MHPGGHTAHSNVLKSDTVLRRLTDREKQLRKPIDGHWFGGAFTNADVELEQTTGKMADVRKLQELMESLESRQSQWTDAVSARHILGRTRQGGDCDR